MKLYKFFARYILILCLLASPGVLLIKHGITHQKEMDQIESVTKYPLAKDSYLDAKTARDSSYVFGTLFALGLTIVGMYRLFRIGAFAYRTNGAELHIIEDERDLGSFIENTEHHYIPIGLNPYNLKFINRLPPFRKDLSFTGERLQPSGFTPKRLLVIPKRVKLNLDYKYQDYARFYFPFILVGWDKEYLTPSEERYNDMVKGYKEAQRMTDALGPRREKDGAYDAEYFMMRDN